MDPQNPNYQPPMPPGPGQQPGVVYGSGLTPPSSPETTPPPGPKHSGFNFGRFLNPWLIGAIALAVILIIGGGVAAYVLLQPKPVKKAVVPPSEAQLCFVRTAHLDCVNGQGADLTRYDLLVPPGGVPLTNVIASADQSKYLGYSTNDPAPNNIWMLDGKLAATKLNIPITMTASAPSWSRDDKTVLLALKNPQNNQQIYRLTPDNGNLQQLTTAGTSTSMPYETKDGHVLYGVLDPTTNDWQPYLMNGDGGYPHPLGDLSGLASISGFSYDAQSDTIFVYGISVNGGEDIVYATVPTFINNGATNTVAATVKPGDTVGQVSDGTIYISHNSLATILDTSNGNSITVKQFGAPIGMLHVASFHRSDQQKEQAYERIVNLSNTPGDFATNIETIFNQDDQSCQADPTAQADGLEFVMVINQVLNDKYAVVNQGCGALTTTYYALNSSNQWVKVFDGNGTPTCQLINTYNYPASIFQQCYNPAGVLVPNDPKTDLFVHQ